MFICVPTTFMTMLTNRLTIQINSMKRVILGKLIVTQIYKQFPTSYGTQRFTTLFRGPYHWSLPSDRLRQYTPSTVYFCKLHSNIIFPSVPTCSKFCIHFSSYMSCPAYLIPPDESYCLNYSPINELHCFKPY